MNIPFLRESLSIIHYHHESRDGSRFPFGLSGEDIPFEAQRLTVTDEFDALSGDRPYRNRLSRNQGLADLEVQAGVIFDPEIVSAFDRMREKSNLEN